MTEVCSREAVKEFVLRSLRLTPETLGKSKEDVPSVVRAVAGLQYGGHKIELFSRFQNFKPEWFDYWYERHVLTEGHVLRGALRIVNADEYPYYFKATRSVSRRRNYQKCPSSLGDNHLVALNFLREHGPLTPSEFTKLFNAEYSELGGGKRLLFDLYNHGEVARMGRKEQKPLYHAVEKLPYKLSMSCVTEEEAKKWLFLKCLSTYGPFTLKDVAHWVGWNLTETNQILSELIMKKKIAHVKIEDDRETHCLRAEDVAVLNALENDLPEYQFVRILFNDDALLLGYYRRLKEYFRYYWKYPQFSEGIAWRAAILYGRHLIGEAIVDMYADSPFFKVKSLLLRKEFATSNIISKIRQEFARHAGFQNKTLVMTEEKLI